MIDIEKAIENLKERYLTMSMCIYRDYCIEQNQSLDLAIEALEKQIAYTPTTNKLVVGVGRCKCGSEFLDKETNYCGNCGQKLDWE